MLIYLDNCALNRLLDEPVNPRVVQEAAGVREVLRCIEAGEHKLVISTVLLKEINQTRDSTLRDDLLATLPEHARFVSDTPLLYFAARLVMEAAGLGWFDALHVASAAAGGAAVLFTTDDGIAEGGKAKSELCMDRKGCKPCGIEAGVDMSKDKPANKHTGGKLRIRDYTKERKKWLSKVTPEDCMAWAASGEPERILAELKSIQAKKRKRKAA